MSENVVSTLGLIANAATAIGLFFTAIQVRQGSRTSQGQFLLTLDQQLSTFDNIYLRLRAYHEAGKECEALNADELLRVREYMGFLEIIEILIEGKSISEADFRAIFGHRVVALQNNRQVREEILAAAPHKWVKFSALSRRMSQ
ncbi:MAG: hypothetical protein CVU16_02955 [Betaproteobacteria bacterium HGW-Betaproteobacteria-10]|nr:MAG: hypothetical protein CVU16_02955 [Betaproteobacteria bacterium HGW-Betaproteobacteria-10]